MVLYAVLMDWRKNIQPTKEFGRGLRLGLNSLAKGSGLENRRARAYLRTEVKVLKGS